MKKYIFIVYQVRKTDSYTCVSCVFSNLESAEKYRSCCSETMSKDYTFYIDLVVVHD